MISGHCKFTEFIVIQKISILLVTIRLLITGKIENIEHINKMHE